MFGNVVGVFVSVVWFVPAPHLPGDHEGWPLRFGVFRLGPSGAERLWSAAVHSFMSVVQERERAHENHRSFQNSVERIADERSDPLIAGYFSVAGNLHRRFYHDSMEDWERDAGWPKVLDLIRRELKWRRQTLRTFAGPEQHGILVNAGDPMMRMVTHYGITSEYIDFTLLAIQDHFKQALAAA